MSARRVSILTIWLLVCSVLLTAVPVQAETSSTMSTNISAGGGGGGIGPNGEMWVNATSRSGGPMKGAELQRLINFFKGKGFKPTNYIPVWDPSRGIYILIFVSAVSNSVGTVLAPVTPVCRWDPVGQCMRRIDNRKPCTKQVQCIEKD